MTMLTASLLARWALALVFAVAGLAKLSNRDGTREMLAGFGVTRGLLGTLAVALPLFELGIAAALVAPPTAFAAALVALALLALFTGLITINLARGRYPVCNCFGQMAAAPIGPQTLLRNGLLTALALLVVVAGPSAAATWRLDLLFGISPLAALAGAGAVAALLLLLLIAGAQLMILQRLARMPPGAAAAAPSPATPGPTRGLPEGSLAPSFALSDTEGDFITLEQLLAPGRPLILYFTKHDCPPCVAMADEVDRWQRNHDSLLNIVRVSDGVSTGEHYALLQARGEVAGAYDCWGTPCAVLVTADGRIGSLAAQGAGAIRALVKRTAAGAMPGSVRAD